MNAFQNKKQKWIRITAVSILLCFLMACSPAQQSELPNHEPEMSPVIVEPEVPEEPEQPQDVPVSDEEIDAPTPSEEEPVYENRAAEIADQLRAVLSEYDPTSETQTEELNRLIVDYQFEKYWAYTLLPVFDSHSEPSWDAMITYISMVDHTSPETFDEEHLTELVHNYFPTLSIRTDEQADMLHETDGVFRFVGIGLGVGHSYYRLNECRVLENGMFELQLIGIPFWYSDGYDNIEHHSPNFRRLKERYADVADETELQYASSMREYIKKDLMNDLENCGYDLEMMTFTFELKDGDVPFRYYDCRRWPISAAEQRVNQALDPDLVGHAVKDKLIAYINSNHDYIWEYAMGDYDFLLVKNGEETVLTCRKNKYDTKGNAYAFVYDPISDSVSFVGETTWLGDRTCESFAIQRILERGEVPEGQDRFELRKALAQYVYRNNYELQFLPSYALGTQPPWDSLTNFAIEVSRERSFSAEELDQVLSLYFDDPVIKPEDSSYLQYANGLYEIYGLSGEVYEYIYRLDDIRQLGQGVWEADFSAMKVRGYQRKTMMQSWWAEGLRTLELNYEKIDRSYLTEDALLYSMYCDLPLEEQNVTPEEKLTVTFSIQSGEHPFRYLSCERIPQ